MHLLGIFTAVTLILSVCSYPYCNNWCNQGYGGGCCDYLQYGGYGYGQNINAITTTKTYCPVVNCSTTALSMRPTDCTTDDDCKRKEMCCEHPCIRGQKMCLVHVNKNPIERGCKAVTNCEEWNRINVAYTLCKNDDDCKRSDTCCLVPCLGQKVCQKTEATTTVNIDTNVGTGTGHVYCPNPGYCY